MDYNILSKVDSVAADFEAIEDYFEIRAIEAASKIIPEDDLPPDSPISSRPSSPPSSPICEAQPCSSLFTELVKANDVRIKAYKNLPECCLRNFLKGFSIGASGRLAVGLLAAGVSMVQSRKLSSTQLKKFLRQMEMQPVQFGMFLGCLLAGHNSIMYGMRHARGTTHYYSASMAGAVAAWSLLLLPRGARRAVALGACVRALEVSVRLAAEKRLLPTVPHADVALMSVASARIMWCWLFNPDALDPSYLAFVNRMGGKPISFLKAIPHVLSLRPPTNKLAENLGRDRKKLNFPPLMPGDRLSIPAIMHPNQSVTGHFASYTRQGFLRALKVYLPVHLLPLLIFNPKAILHTPLASLVKMAEGVIRSSLFLATYCSLGWLGLTVTFPLAQSFNPNPLLPLGQNVTKLAGTTAGGLCALALLFEKQGRRIELALYCTTQAIRTVMNVGLKGGHGPVNRFMRHGEVALFSASWALLMHAYTCHPTAMRRSYHRLLLRLFDTASSLHKPIPVLDRRIL